MIIFEEQIRDLIALMPKLTDADLNEFDVRYEWGTIDVLNKWLILPETVSKYPLIWLVTGNSVRNIIGNTITRNARFVITTRSQQKDQFNEYQYDTDYSNIILPVYTNFIKLIESSGITKIVNSEIREDFRPNYSVNDNGKGLIDVWNALVIDLEIELKTNRCINSNIKF